MPNLNLNVKIFPFFDSVKTPLTSDGTSDSFGNNGYDNLTLEVSGAGSGVFAVQGCVNTLNADGNPLDDEDCAWTTLAVINANSYSKATSIGANGIYYVGVHGVSRVRVAATSVSGPKTIVGAFNK